MDCGPASLKCLLDGHGVHVSFGRLREACQTDADGTSIDALEEVANQLGLDAEQVMVPAEHLLLAAADMLPALVVVRLPSGLTHFVVLWGRAGGLLQVMDPGTGRRWSSVGEVARALYIHEMPVPAAEWRRWAAEEEFLLPLRVRIRDLGVRPPEIEKLIEAARADPGWRPLAALEGAIRMTRAMCEVRAVRRGKEAARLLQALFTRSRGGPGQEHANAIPAAYWTARGAEPDEEGREQVMLRGAVALRVRGLVAAPLRDRRMGGTPDLSGPGSSSGGEAGRIEAGPGGRGHPVEQPAPGAPMTATSQLPADSAPAEEGRSPPLSPELLAALSEAPPRPGRELLVMLRADGLLAPLVLAAALGLAAAGVVVEALLLRGLLELGSLLELREQRIGAVAVLLVFFASLLLLELPIASGLLRLGRHLEGRLRQAFLEKIPRLGDRYFHSRLTADMAERAHRVPALRTLPTVGGSLIRSVCALVLTTAGIAWLDPGGAPYAAAVAGLSVVLPLALQPLLTERDLRQRTIGGALTRFYLDALLGLVAVRAHAAERSLRREHENLLTEWVHSGMRLLRASVVVETTLSLAGFGMAVWLLYRYFQRGSELGTVLLLVYWVLSLPALGTAVAAFARAYPGLRNVTLRLFEPLGAPEESEEEGAGRATAGPANRPRRGPVTGVLRLARVQRSTPLTVPGPWATRLGPRGAGSPAASIQLRDVTIRAAGHVILEGIDLDLAAGSHVAIVGTSGAGKSSLVGLLLGWHRPAAGQIRVDGQPLDAATLTRLRRETAWVDPAVRLWNRSFLANLRYGSPPEAVSFAPVIAAAQLQDVLQALPDGLQTALGEGGALVSGGQGQRVRLGRAMLRPGVRLVILDEAFRGLERGQRRALLERSRRWWRKATLLCITHDLQETLGFSRVIVLDQGRIVEDGDPQELLRRSGSRYRALYEAEQELQQGTWRGAEWRRLWLENGSLSEAGPAAEADRDGSEEQPQAAPPVPERPAWTARAGGEPS
jgi:ABC-type bacteriocin/lantibiotic exporter with double-glycine peptidase domain